MGWKEQLNNATHAHDFTPPILMELGKVDKIFVQINKSSPSVQLRSGWFDFTLHLA